MATLLPPYDLWKRGMLEWQGQINPLACGIKCASRVTTVSWSYLEELKYNSNGLESLIQQEIDKCSGILNGIDAMVWNPAADQYLKHSYHADTVTEGKAAAKQELCAVFGLDPNKPLFVFIGRLVGDKAADLLPSVVGESFYHLGRKMSFLFLGSGDPQIEAQLNAMNVYAEQDYSCYIGYNEGLSHQLYAGADFLLMPSRVEPCGLNQMYALRYGTVPLVRKTGGLKDTIKDLGEEGGYGFLIEHASMPDVIHAISRALEMYEDKEALHRCRKQMMNLDFSWQHSVRNYLYLYHSVMQA
jgi:starch synthase